MYSCGPGHPIYDVPVELQAAYARTVTPEQLAATLSEIDSKDKAIAKAATERIWKAGLAASAAGRDGP